MTARNRVRILASLALGGFIGPSVRAQSATSWPSAGPIKVIIPYPPGGGSDFTGRLLAQKLAASLGQTVVVDNRPGANGLIGTEVAAHAAADGYTLLYADSAHGINPATQASARYDAIADFEPITLVASAPQMMVANPSVPFETLKSLIEVPRAQTSQMSIATPGLGSSAHLTCELLAVKSGLKLVDVPYKGGGPALADAIAGHVPLAMNSAPACIPHIQAGRLKALGTAAPKRDPRMPAVPTFIESGADVVVLNWYGMLAPAKTPAVIVDRLAKEFAAALDTADVKEKFAAGFLDPMPQGPAAFRQFLEKEVQQWKQLVKSTGIRVQ